MLWIWTIVSFCVCVSLPQSTANGQEIIVGAPKADSRVTFPIVVKRPAGSLASLQAGSGSKVRWAIIGPLGFTSAHVADDSTLLVTVPTQRLTVLATINGERCQLLLIDPSDAPSPDPPGPNPPQPVPPTPINVQDTYHVGQATYNAFAGKSATAKQLAPIFRSYQKRLNQHELAIPDSTATDGTTIAGAWTLLWNDLSKAVGSDATLRSACKASQEAFKKANDDATISTLADWILSLDEAAKALEAVK